MNIGVNARLLLNENMEGMSRYIYETTFQMATDHPDDKFYLFYDRQVNANFTFPNNVSIVIVPLQARHPILWHIWFEYLLPIYLKKHKIDVFYSGDGYMSLRTKTPTVLVTHDLAYLHFAEHIPLFSLKHYQHFIPKYHQKAKSIITVSEYVKQDIVKNLKISPDKITVAYNAVKEFENGSTDEQSSENKISEKPYFIYIGSLHPRKNIVNLIKAFNKFNESDNFKYNLVLVGRLAWKSREILQEINQSEFVIHTGMISEELKYHYLKNAIAMVYVSLFEGFGIPILEAMQNQVPVITSNTTSMPEVAGNAALIVDPTDIRMIADAMRTLANNDALRNDYLIKGRLRNKEFSWQNSADIIYRKLLQSCE